MIEQPQPLYKRLARLVGQYHRCVESNNVEWRDRSEERIRKLVNEHLPHGSGFDSGCALQLDASTEDKLTITTSFHHMNENGYYDGWTEHVVRVKASLAFGFTLTISGPNRNQIKDHFYECFDYALRELGPEWPEEKQGEETRA
jgi:hypothetical protein